MRSISWRTYVGEHANIRLRWQTEHRWALVTVLLGQGAMAVRELARRVGRDVKRVHPDVQVLAELGLVERDEASGVLCPSCASVATFEPP